VNSFSCTEIIDLQMTPFLKYSY